MPAIEQIVDPVFLRRDGKLLRRPDDVETGDVDLVSARRPRVGAHRSVDRDGGLLRQMIRPCEDLLRNGFLRDDGLDEAAAVADGQEMDFSARAAVVQPAADRDGRAVVPRDVFDVDDHDQCSVAGGQPMTTSSNRSRAARVFSRTSRGVETFATSNTNVPSYPTFCTAMSAAGQSIAPSNGER